MADPIIFAIPKGRILDEALPILAEAGIVPATDFHDKNSRALRFATNNPDIDIIRVRAFDVATFVAHGAAQLGIVGSDVLEEFRYSEIYAPVDLDIGHCRLSVAAPRELAETDDPGEWSHIRIATKYPSFTRRHFEAKGVQAECVKLNGAMEIAPALGLTRRIVDLVSTGGTLKANNLVEVDTLCDVTSRLIVNRAAFKTQPEILAIVERFREIMGGKADA
ncbi:MAG: ATP phosphoribosyltransferase [Pseudomonadota bacterium]